MSQPTIERDRLVVRDHLGLALDTHLAGQRELALQQLRASLFSGLEQHVSESVPPTRSRGLLIVAALVGAIGIGGACAYAYKHIVQPYSFKTYICK